MDTTTTPPPERMADLPVYVASILAALDKSPSEGYMDTIFRDSGFRFMEMPHKNARVVAELSLCVSRHLGHEYGSVKYRDRGDIKRKSDGKFVDGLSYMLNYPTSIDQINQNIGAVIKTITDGWVQIDETDKDYAAIFHKEDLAEWYCFMNYGQKYYNDICIRVLCSFFGIWNSIGCHKTFHEEKQYHYGRRLDMTYCFIKKSDFARVIDVMGLNVEFKKKNR